MRRLVVYAREQQFGIAELLRGASVCGYPCTVVRPMWSPSEPVRDVDACFVVGFMPTSRDIVAAYRARGIATYAVDLPRLRHWAVPTVGIFRDADPHTLPLAMGRVRIAPAPWKRPASPLVVVAGQVPQDHAHGLTADALERALVHAMDVVRVMQPKARVVFRPHPLDALRGGVYVRQLADAVSEPDAVPLAEVLASASCVVSWNSGIGWDAIAHGVPVAHAAPARQCAWSPYAAHVGVSLNRTLSAGERRVALCRAASSDWALTEVASGAAVAALLSDVGAWPTPSFKTAGEEEDACPSQ